MTVSPALIVTVLSSVAGFSNSKSMTRMVPGARSGAPWASAGIATAAAAIAIHGRCVGEPAPRLHAAGPQVTHYGDVVDSVNVNVLLYRPVRRASLARIACRSPIVTWSALIGAA